MDFVYEKPIFLSYKEFSINLSKLIIFIYFLVFLIKRYRGSKIINIKFGQGLNLKLNNLSASGSKKFYKNLKVEYKIRNKEDINPLIFR